MMNLKLSDLRIKNLSERRYYFLSLGIILLLSFYPILMGIRILIALARDGHVNALDYPKYVIPYTPIAFALIASVALLPLAEKYFKKYTLPSTSVFGVALFLIFELIFEKITVFGGNGLAETGSNLAISGSDAISAVSDSSVITDVGSYQMYMCRSPLPGELLPGDEGWVSYLDPIVPTTPTDSVSNAVSSTDIASQLEYSPIFKLHFYIISILIIVAVIGVIYGFSKMVKSKNYDKMKPMVLQAVSVSVFIALCIFACFTAFYRTGETLVPPISAFLMSIFFIVFGVTAGAYSGGLLYDRKPKISLLLPALIASTTTIVMYIGELCVMNGILFKFGSGFLFEPLAGPFALIDLIVIIASGLITYALLFALKRKASDT